MNDYAVIGYSILTLAIVAIFTYGIYSRKKHSLLKKDDFEKIEKAADAACYDAMFEVHRLAREHGTTVVIEVDGVTVETPPLTDGQLKERQAKIKKYSR